MKYISLISYTGLTSIRFLQMLDKQDTARTTAVHLLQSSEIKPVKSSQGLSTRYGLWLAEDVSVYSKVQKRWTSTSHPKQKLQSSWTCGIKVRRSADGHVMVFSQRLTHFRQRSFIPLRARRQNTPRAPSTHCRTPGRVNQTQYI